MESGEVEKNPVASIITLQPKKFLKILQNESSRFPLHHTGAFSSFAPLSPLQSLTFSQTFKLRFEIYLICSNYY